MDNWIRDDKPQDAAGCGCGKEYALLVAFNREDSCGDDLLPACAKAEEIKDLRINLVVPF